MDQLKEQLAGVIKYGFWILCGVTIVGSLGVAFWSASGLAADRDAKISELESAKTQIQGIRSELSTHPNDDTRDKMDALLESLQQDVADSWADQYDEQKHLLVWPVDVLGKDFVEVFEAFEPIELEVDYPIPDDQEVQYGLRTRYRDYVGEVLPSIAEIAGAEWKVDFNADSGGGGGYGSGYSTGGGLLGGGEGEDGGEGGYGGGYSGFGGGTPDNRERQKDAPLVKWPSGSQEALLANLFPWRGSDPNTLDVLYSQENLWILRQLMGIIADVNGKAKQPFQATIREINEIAIGRSATMGGSLSSNTGGYGLLGGGGFSSGGSGGFGGEDTGDSGSGAGLMGGPGGGSQQQRPDPADMRYVNINYEPIEAATLRSSLQSASPENAYLAVAKRVPVRLNVKMDQRKIPELVAACGNAALMVEVRQVRVNPKTSSGGYGSMPGGGEGGVTGPMGSGAGMGVGPGEGMSLGGGEGSGGGAATGEKGEFVNDVDVEVYGIVYIYNPPDMEKLGIEQVDEDTTLEGETETLSGESVAPPAAPAAGQDPAAGGDAGADQPDDTQPAETAGDQPDDGTGDEMQPGTADPANQPPAAEDGSGAPPATGGTNGNGPNGGGQDGTGAGQPSQPAGATSGNNGSGAEAPEPPAAPGN